MTLMVPLMRSFFAAAAAVMISGVSKGGPGSDAAFVGVVVVLMIDLERRWGFSCYCGY